MRRRRYRYDDIEPREAVNEISEKATAPAPAPEPRPNPKPDPYLASPTPEFVMSELRKVAAQEDVAQSTKIRALELLMKYFGLLEDRLAVTVEALTPAQRAERITVLLQKAEERKLAELQAAEADKTE
jgi:hypothetical protein